jgi:DcuC family C4-dicarboxylate transporter
MGSGQLEAVAVLVVTAVAIGAAVRLVIKGWDVRLVLFATSLLIGVASGGIVPVVRTFLATISNEKFVVPICCAMGFAYVLRHTGCDRHLVLLLVNPLRRVRWLLIPGVLAVGFLVNIPVISQTSTAVCIGPVVVPLMRAAGYSMPTIGACLLLGVSVGGELLNPGAPELLTVSAANPNHPRSSPQAQATEYLPPLVFTQLAVSVLVFWVMSRWWERRTNADREKGPHAESEGAGGGASNPVADAPGSPERVSVLKALVPLVPLALLFAAGPPLHLFEVPQQWVVPHPPAQASAAVAGYPAAVAAQAKKHPSYNTRLIGLAMLVGVVVAVAVVPSKGRDCVKHFFEGAGYGFTHIISLIVIANCFGQAIEGAGLAKLLGQLIAEAPRLMEPLAAFVPLGFAAVSGSGMASTQSLYGFFHGPALALGLDPVSVGSLVSLGSAAGRTMSPVAAVTLMCATLTGTNPFTLAKRVAVPLLAGMVVVVALRMAGVL